MFSSLSSGIDSILKNLRKKSFLSESDYDDMMRSIRLALIEADVALPVVKSFIASIKQKIVGSEVVKGTSTAESIIKIVHDELVLALGSEESELRPIKGSSMLVVGLQGVGKTTATAKIAKKLSVKHGLKVLVVSLDVYRPAARHQLEILCSSAGITSFPIVEGQKPLEIVEEALKEKDKFDYIIFDTAGRLHVDEGMMNELIIVNEKCKPHEKLLVVDSMTGQDAVNIALNFNGKIDLTGIVLSRVDGDSRGGAALSMKSITNCPIKFMSTGEKIEDLEVFYPERVANRILNMGDIVSLVEQASDLMGKENIEKMQKKAFSGQFSLMDFVEQMSALDKMGGFSFIKKFLPDMKALDEGVVQKNASLFKKYKAIIFSMTAKERNNPDIIDLSRKKRIASGSGTNVSDIGELLKKFKEIGKVYKMFSGMGAGSNGGNIKDLIKSVSGTVGGKNMPPRERKKKKR